MVKRSRRDLLSDLPLDIIHAILERIPFRDAVRTSILSNQWKYKWTTLPCLTFDDRTAVTSSESKLEHFINKLLLLHQGPILKFELRRRAMSQSLDLWLTFLSSYGLKVLILGCFGYYSSRDPGIPASLYSCQNLTHLELYNCDIGPPPPSFKGFSGLRRLVLEKVGEHSNIIQSMLSDINLLEELRLVHEEYRCENGGALHLRIHAPKLKVLHLKGEFRDICLNAPLLTHMCANLVEILASLYAPPRINSVCTYTELLGSLAALEELKGTSYFFEYLSINIASCHTPLVFPHLRLIELSPEVFYDKKVEPVIAHLCKGAPNLHKLKVTYMQFLYRLASLRSDSECPFNFTFERLKVLEFGYPYFGNDVGAINGWMKLMKCLLARSPALETMICVRPYRRDSKLLEQWASTLLNYPRASPNAKIVINKK